MFEIDKILIKVKNSEFLKDSFCKYYFEQVGEKPARFQFVVKIAHKAALLISICL